MVPSASKALLRRTVLRPGEQTAFLVLCILLLSTWYPQLSPEVASPDDWTLLALHDFTPVWLAELSQGRFLQALFHRLLWSLGADPVFAHSFLSLCALPLFAFTALLVARALGLAPGTAWIAALCFIDWTGAELWSFRIGPIFLALGTYLAIVAVTLLREGTESWRRFLSAACLTAALGFYQTAFNYAALLLMLCATLDLLEVGCRRALSRLLPALLILVMALVGYLALERSLLIPFHLAPETRNHLLPAASIPQRVTEVAHFLRDLFWQDDAFRPRGVARIELAALGATFAVAAGMAARKSIGTLLSFLLIAACLLLCVPGVSLPLSYWNGTYRTASAHGLLIGGALAIAWRLVPRFSFIPGSLAVLLIVSDAGLAHRAADEQRRASRHDIAQATMILGRLAAIPGGRSINRIASIGHARWYDEQIVRGSEMNLSALASSWGAPAVYSALYHRAIHAPTRAEEDHATLICKTAPRWPEDGSIVVRSDLAIVCF